MYVHECVYIFIYTYSYIHVFLYTSICTYRKGRDMKTSVANVNNWLNLDEEDLRFVFV